MKYIDNLANHLWLTPYLNLRFLITYPSDIKGIYAIEYSCQNQFNFCRLWLHSKELNTSLPSNPLLYAQFTYWARLSSLFPTKENVGSIQTQIPFGVRSPYTSHQPEFFSSLLNIAVELASPITYSAFLAERQLETENEKSRPIQDALARIKNVRIYCC